MKRGVFASKESGFALIITLSLLALLVLLVVSLGALTRLSMQLAVTTAYQTQARQNALLGLNVALGDLQRFAGPDERLTAQAAIRGSAVKNARLTGIWAASDNAGEPLIWLVSGNSAGNPRLINENTTIAVDQPVLVEKSVTAAADKVRAPKVAIPGLPPAGASGPVPAGNYAYWVGDEGVKASVYVPDATAPRSPAGDPLKASAEMNLAGTFNPANPANVRVLAYDQIPLVAKGSVMTANFHHLTVTSHGLVSPPLGAGVAPTPGIFNFNSTSARAWQAVLDAYRKLDSAAWGIAGSTDPLKGSRDLGNYIATRVRTPLASVAAFQAGNLLQNGLENIGADPGITPERVLSVLGPMLAPRSDTFRIRAYGDAVNPFDASKVEASACCEAVVQRTPEWLDPARPDLGRRFVTTYFRWLGPDDI